MRNINQNITIWLNINFWLGLFIEYVLLALSAKLILTKIDCARVGVKHIENYVQYDQDEFELILYHKLFVKFDLLI